MNEYAHVGMKIKRGREVEEMVIKSVKPQRVVTSTEILGVQSATHRFFFSFTRHLSNLCTRYEPKVFQFFYFTGSRA